MRKIMKKLPKRLIASLMLLIMIFTCFAPLSKVIANDENENVFHLDLFDGIGFTINSVTVNNEAWTGAADEYQNNNNQYHVVISVSGNETTGDIVPRIQYGGNWSNYVEESTQHEGNTYTFVLDVTDSTHIGFLGLEIIENNDQGGDPNEPHFDGKAYLLWTCGNGTCYHYFNDIPNFDDGHSTFYKDTDLKADNDVTKTFDMRARNIGWAFPEDFDRLVEAYKTKNNTNTVDWTKINSDDIIGDPADMNEWERLAVEADACERPANNAPGDVIDAFHECVDDYALNVGGLLPFIKMQPLNEPSYNNAYVSYGDRNFKIVIYNSNYKGVAIGDLSDLSYYPSQWNNPFTKRDQFDISGTTKEKPTGIDSILLESTINIKTLPYNNFEIASMEALDVPADAVTITKVGDEFRLVFSSNFYDNVVFKVTDTNGGISYLQMNRYTIDGYFKYNGNKPVIAAEFYFDRTKSYDDFILTLKIYYKNGTTKSVPMEAIYGIDDGLGNMTYDYEVDEENTNEGPRGKGLKKSYFEYELEDDEINTISKMYINGEYTGSTASNYAGAYVGSGEGVQVKVYTEEGE